jgi:hypothetical protein
VWHGNDGNGNNWRVHDDTGDLEFCGSNGDYWHKFGSGTPAKEHFYNSDLGDWI